MSVCGRVASGGSYGLRQWRGRGRRATAAGAFPKGFAAGFVEGLQRLLQELYGLQQSRLAGAQEAALGSDLIRLSNSCAGLGSVDVAIAPLASSGRGRRACVSRCACVIRVDSASGAEAHGRSRALGHRDEAAIIVFASSPLDDVHANRARRTIGLGPGRSCSRSHSDRQYRQSQTAHGNLPPGWTPPGLLRTQRPPSEPG
jgi:hypothetical protein